MCVFSIFKQPRLEILGVAGATPGNPRRRDAINLCDLRNSISCKNSYNGNTNPMCMMFHRLVPCPGLNPKWCVFVSVPVSLGLGSHC